MHKVPPLSTFQLLGSHFDTCKKGMIELALNGEIPMAARVEETLVAIAVDFRSEINPSTIKLLRSSLKSLRRGRCIATAADKGFEQEISVWYLRMRT
ncbi:hypothetical protein C1H46_036639 [Malus baccata]|uniref:Uncharacterized protein n=1 Tax=Malus baccata TaxID=106549 RepID=A0A540KUK8_MALBA|nr:hypothetical protein C1H46_036639 [Malus baccata]